MEELDRRIMTFSSLELQVEQERKQRYLFSSSFATHIYCLSFLVIKRFLHHAFSWSSFLTLLKSTLISHLEV